MSDRQNWEEVWKQVQEEVSAPGYEPPAWIRVLSDEMERLGMFKSNGDTWAARIRRLTDHEDS